LIATVSASAGSSGAAAPLPSRTAFRPRFASGLRGHEPVRRDKYKDAHEVAETQGVQKERKEKPWVL
jgi:hypothetical protein